VQQYVQQKQKTWSRQSRGYACVYARRYGGVYTRIYVGVYACGKFDAFLKKNCRNQDTLRLGRSNRSRQMTKYLVVIPTSFRQ
jgi:hypothetical protein